jgi:hypothetical protein
MTDMDIPNTNGISNKPNKTFVFKTEKYDNKERK